jgi:thiol-disulfide isomerase/thioredoxin
MEGIMKRFLKVLIIALVMLMPLTFASAKKAKTTTEETVGTNGTPVKLYVFYGSGCSHCADLHTYLSELSTDNNYNYMFEVVDYEVWSDKTNATLMQNVAKELNTSASGVPFYVVGDYYASGFPNISSTDEAVQESVKSVTDDLKAAIKKAYTEANKSNGSYKDIVASVGTGNSSVNDTTKTKSDNDIVGYILLGITIIIVVCIVFGRSSTKEDFEEVVEEAKVEEEVVEGDKAPVKKTTTKKTTTKKTTTKKAASKKTTAKKSNK